MYLICKVKDLNEKTIQKIKLTESGFLNLNPNCFDFYENFLDLQLVKEFENYIQLSYTKFYINLTFFIKNWNLPIKTLFNKTSLPLLNIYKNSHNLQLKDVLFINKEIYFVKMMNINQNFSINDKSETIRTKEISILNDSWIFELKENQMKKCSYCKQGVNQYGELIQICDCQFIHLKCFKRKYENKTTIQLKKYYVKISVKDYYCLNCNIFYERKLNSILQNK